MLVTEFTVDTLRSFNREALFNMFGLAITLFLMSSLITRAFIQASGDSKFDRWNKTLNIITFSLSLVFIFVLVITIWRISQGYLDS